MYSNIKNVQLLVAMLKERNVKNIVVSAGTTHDAIARSIEEDSFFKTYNIVDERSAAFFACGLIQQLNEPVAICCTSGTAASNYMTGVTEAFRRKLQLIVITADKNPYYLAQLEDQMIDQVNLFKTNTKYRVNLPMIKDKKDENYCCRLLNEAFLEMNHHGTGPVQINVPIEQGMFAINESFTTKELAKVNIINRIYANSEETIWEKNFKELKGKKIFICLGQNYNVTDEMRMLISRISKKYNCVFATDKLSNITCDGTLELSRAANYCNQAGQILQIVPDVYIHLCGNSALSTKSMFKLHSDKFVTWLVTEEGIVQDYFGNLTNIYECATLEFLRKMDKYSVEENKTYYQTWKNINDEFNIPKFEYSNLYTVQKLMNKIPKNSILNLANSTTIRIAEFFDLDESIQVYCNRGVNGIDGCMSTFIGQSAVTDKLSFLIIGDLTFFYDMNALWNRYVGKNVRIMLNNNSGAALFHFNQGLAKYPTLNENIAADHNAIAKGWVESLGFKYLSARNKEEFDKNLEEFTKVDSEVPIVLEVFTKKEEDAKIQHELYDYNLTGSSRVKKEVKNVIKKVIGRA